MCSQNAKSFLKKVLDYKKLLIILIVPLLVGILPIVVRDKAAKCAFVVILMAIFWLTEALPLSVTALIPILLFPFLGVLSSDKVCSVYFKDIVMLTFGGLVVANAIELTRLHERIAFIVLLKFGTNPKWLMLGFMAITGFMSLWINNAAATAMMLPVVDAVVKQLVKNDCCENNIEMETLFDNKAQKTDLNEVNVIDSQPSNMSKDKEVKERARKLFTGFLLSCAYSASIGGIGSLVGTPPNVLTKGYIDRYYPQAHLDFLSFMVYALPVSFVMLTLSWVWLVFRWLPKDNFCECRAKCRKDRKNESNGLVTVLRELYESLGPISWAEKTAGLVFLILIIGWVTRDLHVVPGWNYFFLPKYVTDTTPAVLAAFLLFILPRENIFAGKPYNHLLDWKTLQRTFAWDVILLLGGSLAMAEGFQESGLSRWIGSKLQTFSESKPEIILLMIQLITSISTQFTSNISITSIFLPIIDTLAKETNINPLYLILPMTLSVSLAFMLPVASPNNAIIFSSGHIRVIDMVSTGIVMNILGLCAVFLANTVWLGLIFDLNFHKTVVNATIIATNSSVLLG